MKIKQIMPAPAGLKARFWNEETDTIEEMTVDILALIWERGWGTRVVPMVVFADGIIDDPTTSRNFLELCSHDQIPMTVEEAKEAFEKSLDRQLNDAVQERADFMEIERLREAQG